MVYFVDSAIDRKMDYLSFRVPHNSFFYDSMNHLMNLYKTLGSKVQL